MKAAIIECVSDAGGDNGQDNDSVAFNHKGDAGGDEGFCQLSAIQMFMPAQEVIKSGGPGGIQRNIVIDAGDGLQGIVCPVDTTVENAG